MLNDLMALWLAALPLMGSPGPATLSVAAVGVAFGMRRGLAYLLGIIVGTSAVLVMIAFGITALILSQPALVTALTVLAAGYILYLAWKIATAPVGREASRPRQSPRFHAGLALAIANPKAFAAIGAVYASQSDIEGAPLLDGLFKIAALLAVIVLVNMAWLGFGSSFALVLSNPTWGRIANISFALMLLASVALALLSV